LVPLEETTLPSTISSVTITTLPLVEDLGPELEELWTDFEELRPRL
jgi:hypothetical protein